jgi:hypothetical protein
MEVLRKFTIEPTPENFLAISKKSQNQLGETYTAFRIAILFNHFDDPDWVPVISGLNPSERNKEILNKQLSDIHMDVISKLIAAPRLGLLNKAWGLFYATGVYKYLSNAFQTAGNSRASGSVCTIAVKLFEEAKDFYQDHYSLKDSNPCVQAFLQVENEIAESQQKLKKYKDNGQLLSHGRLDDDTKKVDNVLKSLQDEDGEKKDERDIAADKLFNEIANDVFNKIV